jgi:hypothetical protein
MYDRDEAVKWAGDDIARNGPFSSISHVAVVSEDDKIYREMGEVVRQRVAEYPQVGINYWWFWSHRATRNYLIRGAIVVAALTAVALLAFASFARAEECPPGVQACKVLVLTPDEEQALMQPRGVLDTAREGRPLELGQIAAYFRDRIARAPAGTVPAPKADVPIPRPRPSEAPKADENAAPPK